MSILITSSDPMDIIALFREPKFDSHVVAYRREKWLADKAAEFALRRQAVEAEAARIIADFRARRVAAVHRCPKIRVPLTGQDANEAGWDHAPDERKNEVA